MFLIKEESWSIQVKLVFVVLLILMLLNSVAYSVWTVQTPELFGNGTAYILESDDHIFGVVHAWGDWVIYGTEENCRLVQISGDRIDAAEHPIPCQVNLKNRWFKGWIDFRGHPRKFLGFKKE